MPLSRLIPLMLRDSLLLAATLGLWALTLRAGAAEGIRPELLHILTGLMTAVCGYLVHEWGHLIGAWSRRSVVVLPERISALFLFNFDVGRNNRRQFNAMAAGGFIASLLFVALLLWLAPAHLLAGKLALGLSLLGAIATFIFEVPTAWRVLRGGPIPQQGLAFVSTANPPAQAPGPLA